MRSWQVCLTFDVDLVDHANGADVAEFDVAVPAIRAVFDRHPDWRATWFIRLDDQIATLRGSAAAVYDAHVAVFDELAQRGHELAWHPHAYRRGADGRWCQNTDAGAVADELARLAPLAHARGLRAVRAGWGFHTNQTMRAIADAGFVVDSSAIPRPRYHWETSQKDWTTTPTTPYRPSLSDYRVPGEPHLPLLEVPMSVHVVRAPYDQGPVVRYLNPAYRQALLAPALDGWFHAHQHLVSVTHPYEIAGARDHGLVAHDPRVFESNVLAVEALARARGAAVAFTTVSAFASTMGESAA